jgi:hypothetical protein
MKKLILSFFILSAIAANSQTSGNLTVSVTTAPTGIGGYAPNHVMAIWITDTSGKFIKTILVYGIERQYNLNLWYLPSGGDDLDAVTGATRLTHATRTCSWSGKDVNGTVVADGNYRVRMQLTDDEMPGNNASFTFNKSATPQTLTPTNVLPCFKNISIQWTPVNTAVDNNAADKLFSIYPNPAKSYAYINGFDIKKIELLSLNGKLILSTNQQKLNLENQPKGVYLIKIYTSSATYTKKLEKE